MGIFNNMLPSDILWEEDQYHYSILCMIFVNIWTYSGNDSNKNGNIMGRINNNWNTLGI